VEGSCEHGNEPSGSIKCWEVLEWLHNWWLLKKGSVPRVMMMTRNVSLDEFSSEEEKLLYFNNETE
jgi:hypothetical protein